MFVAQVETGFHAVWDHWMLDSMCSWDHQPEESYCIPPPSPEAADPRMPLSSAPKPSAPVMSDHDDTGVPIVGRLTEVDRQLFAGDMLTRKRMRDPQEEGPAMSKYALPGNSIADYLGQKSCEGVPSLGACGKYSPTGLSFTGGESSVSHVKSA